MLTSKFVNDFGQQNVLKKTLNSIIDEQNDDGGFCESKYMRRNVLIKFINMINHIIFQPKHVKLRSILINLNLLRYKNRNIITHWTPTDRRWMNQMHGIHSLDYPLFLGFVIVLT